MYPKDLKYLDTHQWVKTEENTGIIGITFYAQKKLGKIIFIDLPRKGNTVKQREIFGTIESQKAVSEMYSPVSGEVIEVNEQVEENPGIINEDCYGRGLMIKVNLKNKDELNSLLTSIEYEKLVKEK